MDFKKRRAIPKLFTFKLLQETVLCFNGLKPYRIRCNVLFMSHYFDKAVNVFEIRRSTRGFMTCANQLT